MRIAQHTIWIGKPREAVFTYFRDFSRAAEWRQYVIAMKLGPALAAGCTVIVKAAPETALDPYLLMEAAEEAGLPPGVLNVLSAGRETSEYLVKHPGVDKVSCCPFFVSRNRPGSRSMATTCLRFRRRCSSSASSNRRWFSSCCGPSPDLLRRGREGGTSG